MCRAQLAQALKFAQALTIGVVSLLGGARMACAQSSVADFYAGKTILVIIGYGAGGGYDAYARLLARHMGRHIPGNPVLLPQNMPGAGSIKAANYLFSVAPKDGMTIGTFGEHLAIDPLMGTLVLDTRKFSWLGSARKATPVCLFSTKSPISSWSDMLTKEHSLGGQAHGTEVELITNTFRAIFHTKSKLVEGYNGQREIMLAMQRGEVDGNCGQSYESFTTFYSDMVRRNEAKIVVYAAPQPLAELKDVPNAFALATSDEERSLLEFVFGISIMSRVFVAPPGIPTDRKLALRKAFDDTMRDPQFLAEANQQHLEISPTAGSEIESLLGEIYATPKAVIERATQIANMP